MRCGKPLFRRVAVRASVSNVMTHAARASSATRLGEFDCADCPRAGRCWGEPPRRGAGVLITRRVALPRGERLFRQGDAFDGVYIVASGCVKLRETSADGGERIAALRTPGEIIGLEGWARGRHPHAAFAATDATLCRLSLPAKGGAVSVDLLERVLAKAAVQLERASRPWAGRPAVERVAAFVDDLAERLGDARLAHGAAPLPVTRAEIGSYLGLAEETVVRALAKLSRSERAAACGA